MGAMPISVTAGNMGLSFWGTKASVPPAEIWRFSLGLCQTAFAYRVRNKSVPCG